MPTIQIELQNISKKFDDETFALEQINLRFKAGSKIGLLGETGSGKSTLLRIIGGLEEPTSGVALFEGAKILGPNDTLIPGHKDIIYLAQHFDLPKFITVGQYLDNSYHLTESEALKINKACRIEHLVAKDTSELSGGEKQRVSFAKALTQTPKALLLDEPFSNLDAIHKASIKEVINDIENEFDTTFLLISHDSKDLLSWADDMLVMRNGSIIQQGTPKEIYFKPCNQYVAGLLGKYNLISPKVFDLLDKSRLHYIENRVLVWPEQVILSKEESPQSVKGTVEKVFFMGVNDEVLINMSGLNLIAHSKHGRLKIGDTIFIELDAKIEEYKNYF